MRQIQLKDNEAPKIGGVGTLEYQLWVDDGGHFYVQITKTGRKKAAVIVQTFNFGDLKICRHFRHFSIFKQEMYLFPVEFGGIV